MLRAAMLHTLVMGIALAEERWQRCERLAEEIAATTDENWASYVEETHWWESAQNLHSDSTGP